MNFEITIPILNEEKKIVQKVKQIIEFFDKYNLYQYRLILVDNGSTDGTRDLGEMLDRNHDNVNFLSIDEKGIGRALLHSWSKSKADIIGYMDLDLSTDLKHLLEVNEIFRNIENIDVINSSRLLKQSRVINRKVVREITSRVFNFILKSKLNVKFTDAACGFKFFKNNSKFKKLIKNTNNKEWFFPIEVLVRSEKLGFNIKEIPVNWVDDHDSKVKVFSLSIYFFQEIVRLKREFKVRG